MRMNCVGDKDGDEEEQHDKPVILNLPSGVLHAVVRLNHNILFLLHNCNFAATMNCDVNICVLWWS